MELLLRKFGSRDAPTGGNPSVTPPPLDPDDIDAQRTSTKFCQQTIHRPIHQLSQLIFDICFTRWSSEHQRQMEDIRDSHTSTLSRLSKSSQRHDLLLDAVPQDFPTDDCPWEGVRIVRSNATRARGMPTINHEEEEDKGVDGDSDRELETRVALKLLERAPSATPARHTSSADEVAQFYGCKVHEASCLL
jgi:hypothetical protein